MTLTVDYLLAGWSRDAKPGNGSLHAISPVGRCPVLCRSLAFDCAGLQSQDVGACNKEVMMEERLDELVAVLTVGERLVLKLLSENGSPGIVLTDGMARLVNTDPRSVLRRLAGVEHGLRTLLADSRFKTNSSVELLETISDVLNSIAGELKHFKV